MLADMDEDDFIPYIDSMPDRIEAVIEKRGWSTSYYMAQSEVPSSF